MGGFVRFMLLQQLQLKSHVLFATVLMCKPPVMHIAGLDCCMYYAKVELPIVQLFMPPLCAI
jgi:hypothetical protein